MNTIWPYIIMLLIGIGLTLWREKRAFYRRNEAGVEEFNNFGSALSARIIETTAYVIGRALIGVGVIGFVVVSLIG